MLVWADMQRFVRYLKSSKLPGLRLVHHHFLPARAAVYDRLSPPLPPPLERALATLGISRLYQHQVEALSSCRSGRHTIIATPTASGKSLIYNLAFMEVLAREARGHGLYLFPLKALAQDQFQAFVWLNQALPSEQRLRAAVYDGDTPPSQRRRIKADLPDLIISNPDMLHLALLPYHQQWQEFFSTLRLVVVDEVHTYRGIFGSHVVQILRRLQRVCRFYGSSPRYILLSATIANAREFAGRLTGMVFEPVENSGAPQAGRHFFFVDPEGSAASAAARLFVQALKRGLKTIAFTQARKLTEVLHMNIARAAPELASRVSSYRAGFLADERRHIERGLAGGAIAGVISTSALEMGVDIGGLDVCILVGYPGTIITTWQRSGRVGRGGQDSAIILVAQPDALDQYFLNHPEEFFSRPFEAAVVDPDNTEVVDAHLPCAAAEIPLDRGDELYGASLAARAEILEGRGELLRSAEGDRWYASRRQPQRRVDIRSVGPGYTILEEVAEKVVGKNDGTRVFRECHPGAIYLHRGQQYLVSRLDLERQNVWVRPTGARYYTRALAKKETEILAVDRSRPVANFVARLGRLRVTEQVIAYEKRNLVSGELLESQPLDLPPQSFETVGLWLEMEKIVRETVEQHHLHFMGGIHALEHALISMFPLFALCDRNDIGGIAVPAHRQLENSAVFVYDGTPGGVGLAARGYEMIEALLEKTGDLIASCPCDNGCPSCIHSPKCGSGNKPLDKEAALLLVRLLLGREPLEVKPERLLEKTQAKDEAEQESLAAAPGQPAVLYLDIETQRLADEVGGWENARLMRLAVAVLYDQRRRDFEVFEEGKVEELIRRLQRGDLVVGFNLKRFDYRVLAAYTPFDLQQLPTFDLLEEIHNRLGFRLSLGHLAEHTLGRPKSADGIQAVRWFRQGNLEAVLNYCREDVAITRDLFRFALQNGYLVYQTRQGQAVRLPLDWNLAAILQKIRRC